MPLPPRPCRRRKFFVVCFAAVTPLLLAACAAQNRGPAAGSKSAVQSVYTTLDPNQCRKEIDRNDPNDTPYLVCPGVAGYSLIQRRADAGRVSLDVADAAGHVHPLNYQEFVTRYMCSLDGNAEWRVSNQDGRQTPVALIVQVQAREDNDSPERVTHTYFAVSKITPDAACVTDVMDKAKQTESEVRRIADSAHARPCAPPQPPLRDNGNIIR